MPIEDQRVLRLRAIARAIRLDSQELVLANCSNDSHRHNSLQQCLELIECFQKIGDPEQRGRVLAFAKHLASPEIEESSV